MTKNITEDITLYTGFSASTFMNFADKIDITTINQFMYFAVLCGTLLVISFKLVRYWKNRNK